MFEVFLWICRDLQSWVEYKSPIDEINGVIGRREEKSRASTLLNTFGIRETGKSTSYLFLSPLSHPSKTLSFCRKHSNSFYISLQRVFTLRLWGFGYKRRYTIFWLQGNSIDFLIKLVTFSKNNHLQVVQMVPYWREWDGEKKEGKKEKWLHNYCRTVYSY